MEHHLVDNDGYTNVIPNYVLSEDEKHEIKNKIDQMDDQKGWWLYDFRHRMRAIHPNAGSKLIAYKLLERGVNPFQMLNVNIKDINEIIHEFGLFDLAGCDGPETNDFYKFDGIEPLELKLKMSQEVFNSTENVEIKERMQAIIDESESKISDINDQKVVSALMEQEAEKLEMRGKKEKTRDVNL